MVHHAIEQQIVNKYPGLFTEAELHELGNLRGIPNELNNDIHLSKIRKQWNAFYRTHPTATREQVLQKVKDIDDLFGSQFKPPVR